MTRLDLDRLKQLLGSVSHATPLNITALVDARAKKKATLPPPEEAFAWHRYFCQLSGIALPLPVGETIVNPFHSVAKLSVVNGFTGFDYEASVNRQHVREGTEATFAAQERAWGTVVSPALVENKGEFYLRLKVERTAKPVYLTRKTAESPWLVTPKETITPFLPPPSTAPSQGLEREVVYRNYKLASLVSLSMDGSKYRIRH